MNLVRMGHYHTPSGEGERGSCQTAIVAFTNDYDHPAHPADQVLVNITVFNHSGEFAGNHTFVPVAPPRNEAGTGATFHLSGECPWNR